MGSEMCIRDREAAPPTPQLTISYSPETVYVHDVVTITVTAEGSPVAGASVTIVDPDGVSIERVTTSAGTCSFTADKTGIWTVTASKSGYTDAQVAIEVSARPAVTEWTIELSEGWNLISLPLIPDSTNITEILSDANLASGNHSNLSMVYYYNASADTWLWYTPIPAGTLTTMVDGLGYWVYADSADVLTVHGTQMPPGLELPPTYDVVEGWNMIGFKSTVDMPYDTYLISIAGDYAVIYGFDADAQEYFSVYPLPYHPMMEPGHGYWIWMSTDGTIVPV